jgi:hypothetical protein
LHCAFLAHAAGEYRHVAVRPHPRVAEGQLSPADFTLVNRWVALNEAVLVDYWDGKIDTSELLARLQRMQ